MVSEPGSGTDRSQMVVWLHRSRRASAACRDQLECLLLMSTSNVGARKDAAQHNNGGRIICQLIKFVWVSNAHAHIK